MAIKQWQVYFIHNCRHVRPDPKGKFVVIAHTDAGIPHGFFINSRIHPYIRRHDRLYDCQAQVIGTEHSFLTHDSAVDCIELYDFTVSELRNLRGSLSPAAIGDVLAAVHRCKILTPIQKQLIIDEHNASRP